MSDRGSSISSHALLCAKAEGGTRGPTDQRIACGIIDDTTIRFSVVSPPALGREACHVRA